MNQNDVYFSDRHSQERRKLIDDKLVEFNKAQSPQVHRCYQSEKEQPDLIEVYAQTKSPELIGGLIGYIDWGWLDIDVIWINEVYRGKGIGKHLVATAEQKARDKGIKRAKLCTFDFQALEFYEKLGYIVYGKLDDYPEGHSFYYLRKNLNSPT